MKLFCYSPNTGGLMGQWQFVHFFDELKRHGIEIFAFNSLFYRTDEEALKEAIKELDKGSYDLFFTGVSNEKHIPLEILSYCKQKGIPTLFIRWDNYVIPYNDENISSLFDLVWITSQETKYLYDKFGAKTIFAPYAANPYKFTYNENLSLIRKACFIGTPHSSRANMINKLTRDGISVDTFFGKNDKLVLKEIDSRIVRALPHDGILRVLYNRLRFSAGRTLLYASVLDKIKKKSEIDYNTNLTVNPRVSFDDMQMLYSQYSISLAFTSLQHSDVLKNPIKIVDLRNFEIPMCGGIEFCRYHEEMASYFEDKREIVFFDTDEELIDKAKYYTTKASDQEIRSIKTAARRRAENEHTWMRRFSLVFNELGLKY